MVDIDQLVKTKIYTFFIVVVEIFTPCTLDQDIYDYTPTGLDLRDDKTQLRLSVRAKADLAVVFSSQETVFTGR